MRIGERLMRAVERRVFAEGARWMELHVFTRNDGAIRFYERLGYARVAMQQRFYGADGLDGLLYRRELTAL